MDLPCYKRGGVAIGRDKMKTKHDSFLRGFHRCIIAKLTPPKGKSLSSVLWNQPFVHRLESVGGASNVSMGYVEIDATYNEGLFTPSQQDVHVVELQKIIQRGFRAPVDARPSRRNSFKFKSYIVSDESNLGDSAILVSIGAPLTAVMLGQFISSKFEIKFERPNLRLLCDYLFQNPNFSDIKMKRLNLRPFGRDVFEDISTVTLFGDDIFRSSFLSDLIRVKETEPRMSFPFGSESNSQRSLWRLEPTSCRLSLESLREPFSLNIDRFGNFVFFLRGVDDLAKLFAASGAIRKLTEFDSVMANPLRKILLDNDTQ